jgi:hypothetical protein
MRTHALETPVDKLLAGYRRYLVADAHAVYDHAFSRTAKSSRSAAGAT